jgi:fructuronate reductase
MRLADGLLGVSEIFGNDLPRSESLRQDLVTHLESLLSNGARQTVQVVAGLSPGCD